MSVLKQNFENIAENISRLSDKYMLVFLHVCAKRVFGLLGQKLIEISLFEVEKDVLFGRAFDYSLRQVTCFVASTCDQLYIRLIG